MSRLDLIGLVVAALVVVALVVLLRVLRRRRAGAVSDPERPRTVADLVRLRAEAAADAPPAADDRSATEPGDGPADPVPADPTVPREPEPPSTEPHSSDPAADPEPTLDDGAEHDTPWRRAGRMSSATGGVDAVPTGPPHDEDDDAATPEPGPGPEPEPEPAVPLPFAAIVAEAAAAGPASLDVNGGPPDPPETGAAAAEPGAAEAVSAPDRRARHRLASDELADEQDATDLALLRAFGDASVEPPAAGPAATPIGASQAIRIRVVRRDGAPVGGAVLTLLDDRGAAVAAAAAGSDGRGELDAPHPGSYVVVSAAPGHQPGAAALTVGDEPREAELILARSASVAGVVRAEEGPVPGARVTLTQDREIVDAVDTGSDGRFLLTDLAAGEYQLSVAAAGRGPVATSLRLSEEADVRHDVVLDPTAG